MDAFRRSAFVAVVIAVVPAMLSAQAGSSALLATASGGTAGVAMAALAACAAAALTWLAVGGVWSSAGRRSPSRATAEPPSVPPASLFQARETSGRAFRLADVPVGFTARLHEMQLDGESRSLLRALGLTDASMLRVCKQGEPCVVQVRTTRIGISGRIARHVFVVPANERAPVETP